jgi:hypothetical protein
MEFGPVATPTASIVIAKNIDFIESSLLLRSGTAASLGPAELPRRSRWTGRSWRLAQSPAVAFQDRCGEAFIPEYQWGFAVSDLRKACRMIVAPKGPVSPSG